MKYSINPDRAGGIAMVKRKSMKFGILLHCLIVGVTTACSQPIADLKTENISASNAINAELVLPGIHRLSEVLADMSGKKVGVVANHTSLIGSTHLVDTLLGSGVEVVRIFAPEHGFRGDQADGAEIENGRDKKTGLEVVSLYGKNKKPQPGQLEKIDLLIFDIQDVGARFYTYLSTLHYVMEAAAEQDLPLMVFDRPNPNGHYVDGPVLEPGFTSFVGLHPVPTVYGMTIGEYALMINGEKWLKDGVQCDVEIVQCIGYTHQSKYELPVRPSPNLPDTRSIRLYPSLCFFEGTQVSVGRGTEMPFSIIGEPANYTGNFTFTPRPIAGASTSPPNNGVECRGYDLRSEEWPEAGLQLQWLIRMYQESNDKEGFFLPSGYFDKLAGNSSMRNAVKDGVTLQSIRESWQPDLDIFMVTRAKYLLYD